ncbi:dedicator of cytokinesis protein 7 isoform X2 [Hydra vulgaris]|uniref:Dedicator of cytokinesis protein 7 isoform X2 n=1 Tax=Hydra vulgaris TaxID=6087 RepID=A0ABM4DJ47_HYDVU
MSLNMGKERAFAQRLHRNQQTSSVASSMMIPGNRQSQISKVSLTELASYQNAASATFQDVVEPVDFEEFIMQQQSLADDNNPLAVLSEFPDDDIEVTTIKRAYRTVGPSVPDGNLSINDSFVKDCIKSYTNDWSVVNRKYQMKGFKNKRINKKNTLDKQQHRHEYEIDSVNKNEEEQKKADSLQKAIQDTPRGSWASSIFDLQSCPPDPLLEALFDDISFEEMDRQNEIFRHKKRLDSMFSFFTQSEDVQFVTRTPAVIPQEHFGQRILVRCTELKLDLDVEPIFATMALYDYKQKKKISENFHFDMNEDSHKKMMSSHSKGKPDISTLAKSCIFSVTYPSNEVCLVIKLEKVLQQGEITDCAEPYMKDSDNPKVKEKARALAEQFCEKNGAYRMPFAWTAIHLVDVITGANVGETNNQGSNEQLSKDNGNKNNSPDGPPSLRNSMRRQGDSLTRRPSNNSDNARPSFRYERTQGEPEEHVVDLNNFRAICLTVSTFFKQESEKLSDDDLIKLLADLRRPNSLLKKLKCIQGILKMDITPPPENIKYSLTPELQPVNPYPDKQGAPVKEIQEFAPKEVFVPYVTYRNTLYVYPTSLNFTNRSGSARNIAIKIQLMAGEDSSHALLNIYGKSCGKEFVSECYTPIVYHNKYPFFYEEVKVKLPMNLDDRHHLLFTFYHISFKSDTNGSLEATPVGFTWVPLLKDGRLHLGEFNLPVAIEKLPSGYSILSTDTPLPNMKWVDGHKGIFTCAVRAETSLHTQEIYLHRFFQLCHYLEGRSNFKNIDNSLEKNLRRTVKDLEKCHNEPLIKFLYHIIDKLFMLLVKPTSFSGTAVNVSQCAFEALTEVVYRVHELPNCSQNKHGHSNLLSSYVTYIFNLAGSCTPTVTPTSSPNFQNNSPNILQQSSLSSSNPTIYDQTAKDLVKESWMDDIMNEYNNLSRNRNSVAEQNKSSTQQQFSHKLVHEEIAMQWAVAQNPFKEHAMNYAWFYFDIMAKSMAQYLDLADRLFWSRKERFHERFLDDVVGLVTMITSEIINTQDQSQNSQILNFSLAFFLNDLFSLMDRGYVLNLVKIYLKEMSDANGFIDQNILSLKMEFLQILSSHEHFVVLNLPFPIMDAPSMKSPTVSLKSAMSDTSSLYSMMAQDSSAGIAELSIAFREQHFLIGALLCEVKNSFDTNENEAMSQAVDIVKDAISLHDVDSRYDLPECRSRIASLYLPLLAIVMEILPTLHGYESEKDELINESVANAIATSSVLQKNRDDRQDIQSQISRIPKLSMESTKNILMCFLWVLKNLSTSALKCWVKKMSATRLVQLLEVLDLSIKLFEYQTSKKDKNQKNRNSNSINLPAKSHSAKSSLSATDNNKERLKNLENAIMNPSASQEMRRRKEASMERKEDTPKLRWNKEQTVWKKANKPSLTSDQKLDNQVEGIFSAEMSMTVLDTIELLVQSVETNDMMKSVVDNCLRVLLHCLSCNQSIEVLQNMFATQRCIVKKFPELVFEDETELCADLCYRLLTHCSSSCHLIRAQASASLYLLMRQNYEIGNNFSRVKMQVTMSLSTLVGSAESFRETFLRKSLKTIITYAQSDQQLKATPFPEQVRELVFNLHMILTDTVKMKEYEEDREMYIDLQYRIAKGYQTSPDLRLTWLQNMAKDHIKYNNFTEAGMCLVHSAALVSEYLSMFKDKRYLPIGCVSFHNISTNTIEESATSEDVISVDDEGICSGKYFSESGLVGLLEHAVHMFKTAQMFELVNEVDKLLIPILEAQRDTKKLHMLHMRLADGYNKIMQIEGKRMLGTYFRVGFFGSIFGDIDTEEFIYKEPAITKLPEVSHRLLNFYKEKFGEERIEILKDSNVVDSRKLDDSKGYIQITYVEPYFLEYELEERETYFELNNNLRRFMFVTPFTPSGKAHGDLADQYKRKTILTLANAFPYIKTRINVVQREEIVLTPIEVAIEDVESKTNELKKAMSHSKPDVKMLQMVLQGSVGTTVNQGPFEIANVFLSDFDKDRNGSSTITRHHHKLRLCFKEFVKRCEQALIKNKALITLEQKAYQKELEKNFQTFVEKLEPLLKSKFGNLRGSIRKSHDSSHFKNFTIQNEGSSQA